MNRDGQRFQKLSERCKIVFNLVAVFHFHDFVEDFFCLREGDVANAFFDTRNGRSTHRQFFNAHSHQDNCRVRVGSHFAAHACPFAFLVCGFNRAFDKAKDSGVEVIVEVRNLSVASVDGECVLNEVVGAD